MVAANQREQLFNDFSKQLLILKSKGLITREFINDEPYICPICDREFTRADLDTTLPNHLTLEDTPPKSLGGKPIVLTCKECNNTCGTQVDVHLVNAMKRYELKNFRVGSVQQMFVEKNGRKIKAIVEGLGNGELKVNYLKKNNDPKLLQEFVDVDLQASKEKSLLFVPVPLKILTERVEIALLKSAYIAAFARYGYLFILDPMYNDIRRQIRFPDQEIFRYKLHHQIKLPDSLLGPNLVLESHFECVAVVMKLQYLGSVETFTYFLPLPIRSAKQLIHEIIVREFGGKRLAVNVSLFPKEKNDYIRDVKLMTSFSAWLRNKISK